MSAAWEGGANGPARGAAHHDALPLGTGATHAEGFGRPDESRLLLRCLVALTACGFGWAWFAPLDVIAVAQGRLVPRSQLQVVQPAESGVVREILVREGEAVTAGQVLARMDLNLSEADSRQLQAELALKRLQVRRVDAELAGVALARVAADPPDLFAQVEAQHRARRQSHLDALAAERAILSKAEQDLRAAAEVESKLQRTLPIYRQQEQAIDDLTRDGFAGRLMLLDRQRDRIEKEQDLAAQRFTIASLRASVGQSQTRLAQIQSGYNQQLRNERVEAEGQYRRLMQDWERHQHRRSLLELRAPHDGTVKDLATRTAGSVVSGGTVLMTVVPSREPLLAEVWVANQDAGFVATDQPVRIKVSSFPFQKFGVVQGRIAQLSPDSSDLPQAQNLEKRRADIEHVMPSTGYRTLIALDSDTLPGTGGRDLRLVPGMQVSAEIHLGTRTVMDYLLSPIQKVVSEAARER